MRNNIAKFVYAPVDLNQSARLHTQRVSEVPCKLIDFADVYLQSTFQEVYSPSFKGFMTEVLKKTDCALSTFIVALMYLQQLARLLNVKDSDPRCVHRLFLVGLLTASKYLDDFVVRNVDWAELANVDVRSVNAIEREFLQFLNYDLYISVERYQSFIEQLQAVMFEDVYNFYRTEPYGLSCSNMLSANHRQYSNNYNNYNYLKLRS
eukprot:Colp12_sorted_trinity150504_noHs@14822